MIVAAVIAFCILLLVLAFLAPRMSRHAERGGDRTLAVGQRAGGAAPGFLGRWLQKPFGTSRKAVSRSGSAGRRGRGKMPV
ncbi:MAG: hypothetical protein QOC95_429 [Thermoleophilaceae bacterium]|jgi:hypothetical protein|nr:hypothetical protein [Thermoleophilaceae bacterium]